MKSLKIDAVMPWEIGLCLIFIGILLIFLGMRQTKKEFDFNKIPFTRPTTKIILGTFLLIIGGIQLLPLIK